MSKTAAPSTNLPPRHSGYRAATSGRFVTTAKSAKARVLPTPPAGDGGGSKSKESSDG